MPCMRAKRSAVDDARLRRPSWRDPRLGVGVLLVAVAVVLGSWAVSSASQTVDVFATDTPLTPGDTLSVESLRPQAVRPDGLEDAYLPVADGLPADSVVTRVVGAGELVPATAVGGAAEIELRPVVLDLDPVAAAGVRKGATVDLWLTEPAGIGGVEEVEARAEPTLLAAGLVVAGLVDSDSIFAGTGGSAVQVLVPQGELPEVLAARSGGGAIVVVPVPGGTT